MPNRLIDETSPYLLQHAHNPVDWYAWGDEAFSRARGENKPLFLSIGYSACHWCHVMERESFENEEIAAILNEHFVSVKVDREERPDVDSIYMTAVQLMTGHGGWPMSMFLSPDGRPFFGGTYFPPEDARGMPGFKRILLQIAEVYRSDPGQISEVGERIVEAIRESSRTPAAAASVRRDELDEAAGTIVRNYDRVNGGFGGAPKFPPAMALDFLQQVAWRNGDDGLREVVATTLTKMARGGIYDQIGGGFHRYSVDSRWLVPHFEKMLYDNALLVRTYTRAWQWMRDPLFERVVRETLGFVEREMTSPEGGFYSTLDADSEGEEGKFYVWSREEVLVALGADDGRIFAALYDVTERGNFEGHSILNVPREPASVAADLGVGLDDLFAIGERGARALFERRSTRIRPGRDEKVLAGWNGWMLAAFAEAAAAFDSEHYREIARRNADFLLGTLVREGRLMRSFKDGRVTITGLLEDYGGVAVGLLAAFEATGERRYLDGARMLVERVRSSFRDEEQGGFFDTPEEHETLITRPKNVFDNATPAGNSLVIDALLRLSLWFGDEVLARDAESAIRSLAPLALRHPGGFGWLLTCAEWYAGAPKEIIVSGNDGEVRSRLLRVVGETYVPHRIVATSGAAQGLPLVEGREGAEAMAYVCRGYRCEAPTADPGALLMLLESRS
jgi:uncharacterized protein